MGAIERTVGVAPLCRSSSLILWIVVVVAWTSTTARAFLLTLPPRHITSLTTHCRQLPHPVVSARHNPWLAAIAATTSSTVTGGIIEEERSRDEGAVCKQQLELLARTAHTDPTAVAQATELFDSIPHPDTALHNALLKVYAAAYSSSEDPRAVERAEKLVETMPAPDTESFCLLMDAYMRHGGNDSTCKCEEIARQHPESVEILNKLIRAHRSDTDKVLELLDANLDRANQATWVQVLRAFRNNKEQQEELLGRMARGHRSDNREDWQVSTAAYNVYLQSLLHEAPKECERVLYEMVEQYRNGDNNNSVCKPDNASFCHVYASLQHRSKGVAFKVTQLLSLQTALGLVPDAKSLTAAMVATSRDRTDPKKALKCQKLYERLAEPTLYHAKVVLNACVHMIADDPRDRLAAFQIAADTFQKHQDHADSSLYGQLLEATANLMVKRDATAESIFTQCCQAGLVNDYVLEQLERAASGKLLLQLLGGFLEDGVQLPADWSRNVIVRKQDEDREYKARQLKALR
jgi:hypothetical protein